MSDAFEQGALELIEEQIDAWLRSGLGRNLSLAAVDRGEPAERRWYVRLRGEQKDVITIWLTLGQRTLRYEAYVMAAPEENEAELYEHLLRRNHKMVGAHFSIGQESAVFLVGQLPLAAFSEGELDRIVGSVLAYVEQCFPAALRIGFRSKLVARET